MGPLRGPIRPSPRPPACRQDRLRGGGSGAPPAQRIRPARGTGEAGAAGGAPAWPQFPLPARRLHRPLSDNAPLSDLPLPRSPPLRPTGLHNACVMQTTGRGTRPTKRRGAHGRAPCTLGPRGRSGSAARGLRASQPGIISSPKPALTRVRGRSNHAGLTGPPVLRPGRTALTWCVPICIGTFPRAVYAGALSRQGRDSPRPLAGGVGPAPRARRARIDAIPTVELTRRGVKGERAQFSEWR